MYIEVCEMLEQMLATYRRRGNGGELLERTKKGLVTQQKKVVLPKPGIANEIAAN